MDKTLASLSQWFSERPQWLQNAATRLLKQASCSDEDIAELTTLCLQEVEGGLPPQAACSFNASTFAHEEYGTLRLCSVTEIEGVNALAPTKPLEFGKGNITIVYGLNGSGKTGYIRLLKHICGARNPGRLHGNVYMSGTTTTAQKAAIIFEQDGVEKKYAWMGQGICDDLTNIDIFDASYAQFFVSNEAEVSYEPPILSFFSSLTNICEKVSRVLDAEAHNHPSQKPTIPPDKKLTAEGRWYDSIGANTTPQDIETHCFWGDKDDVEVQTIQQRLAEQAPAEKAIQLKTQKQHADSLVQDALKYMEQLSDENCRQIVAAKRKSSLKKAAADNAAKKVFAGSYLEGIGSDIWKELWDAARKYSMSFAYKEHVYPNISDGARCVLCHQSLEQTAKDRLASFEEFIKGEMQRSATEAAEGYELALRRLEDIPTNETLKTKIDATGIQQGEVTTQVFEFFEQLRNRKNKLPEIDCEGAIPALSTQIEGVEKINTHSKTHADDGMLTSSPQIEWIEKVRVHSKHLGELASKYEEDAKTDNRTEVKNRLDSLQAKKWLSEQREAITEEIKRQKLLSQIQKATRMASTGVLSTKKGELAETFITETFVQRFNKELEYLGASQVKVELIKTRTERSKVLHKLQLRGVTKNVLEEVLSEGEYRIIAIAAFLADVTGKNNQAPFIFDDPISSLVQKYEEAVVKRLIALSHSRQVIVFTHRLSLLGTVRHFAEKESIKPYIISIRSVTWGAGEPAPIPLSQSDISSALNVLIHQRLQDVKKAHNESDFENEEVLLTSICSDFRKIVERSIENDLLCGVVQRFQLPVNTLKLKNLAKLQPADCNFLDSLMTKYSGPEHSQPGESPVELPTLDKLLSDMEQLKNWREAYLKRPAPSSMGVLTA